jgi:hypothetical protein
VATRANAPAPSPSGSAPPTRASQSGLMEAYPH